MQPHEIEMLKVAITFLIGFAVGVFLSWVYNYITPESPDCSCAEEGWTEAEKQEFINGNDAAQEKR